MKWITYSLLAGILYAIGYLFYTQEVKYWVPTPVPENYQSVSLGSEVNLEEFQSSGKKFIHFYNPNCPCSKFNTKSYKALLKEYHKKFECYVVIQRTLDGLDDDDRSFLKELDVEVLVDLDKKIAKAYGVYATPQIVLVDEEDKIYYRGNYNQARYCTNLKTNFAKMAIDSMLTGSQYLFPAVAFTAYGCDLNRNTD